MVPEWVQDAVFYQIFPERFRNGDPTNDPPGTLPWGGTPDRENFFGGDLRGIIEGLDYLQDLGVTALYLNPIFQAGTNHKYDTHDYFRIDPAFGDDATFDELVSQLHSRGMRLILDGVFNHCGDGFAPFQDLLRNGEASPYKDWFTPYDFPLVQHPHPNYGTCGNCAYLPRLNCKNPEVEAFVHRVALYWLERGIDGWRLDVPYEVHTEFWRRFREVVKGRFPDAYLVAEEWRDPYALIQGDTFDGAMHYRLRDLAFDFILKNALTADAFARALGTMRERIPEEIESGMLTLLGSHDTARLLTECGGNVESAKLLYTLLLTYPGVPMIYYGDENGMTGANDPGCRAPMEWDEARWNIELRDHVRRLIALRREHPELRRGTFRVRYAEDRLVMFERSSEEGTTLVVLNNTYVPRQVTIPAHLPEGLTLVNILDGRQVRVVRNSLPFDSLPARSSLIFRTVPVGERAASREAVAG
ncbi:DUF3459 domain-containing protein [Deinococcus metallilatus]|uniref:DUF3459 domain-containing protein n=1 Tax=Deinococcus metallilatus TaxID=1211322 RepID=A0AAJ5F389_9DEIO|nr:glycoside hydrolase family 13 protein [Deinococcus metallilatus]MBB5296614.1 glycosidase [Deinococcus metallilatus]QBY08367.1 DUF3459 domain-containing protein [Deinococcus metallilatus]RXJ11166.1 DUF3459 domain-containing protein [Deinococcus metallilatus]TLK24657.1 DUF3459 domain-containing protein [Deinococcus metallilatus]GMA17532.1 alpha amylase catalytic subunit [Deinococcus metallilatus]